MREQKTATELRLIQATTRAMLSSNVTKIICGSTSTLISQRATAMTKKSDFDLCRRAKAMTKDKHKHSFEIIVDGKPIRYPLFRLILSWIIFALFGGLFI